jgi:hypothetical protein
MTLPEATGGCVDEETPVTKLFWIAGAVFASAAPLLAQDAPPAAQAPPATPSRRPLMNGVDPDAARVAPKPVRTSIEKLLEQPRPAFLSASDVDPELLQHRASPVETTAWLVDAEVVAHQLMPDGDFRVILKSPSGRALVMELPDPKIAGRNSRWAKELAEVRKAFEARYHPTEQLQDATGRVRVTGIGFFGRPSPRGATSNVTGVQLHPVTKLEFVADAPAKAPAPTKAKAPAKGAARKPHAK